MNFYDVKDFIIPLFVFLLLFSGVGGAAAILFTGLDFGFAVGWGLFHVLGGTVGSLTLALAIYGGP